MVTTPSGASSVLMPATNPLRSGTCASTLLPTTRSAARPSARSSHGDHGLKNECPGAHALRVRHFRHVLGRLDAEDGDALCDEVLEQVAVVAAELDHEAVRVQLEPGADRVGVGARMAEPAVGVGREVGIVGEDVGGRDVLLQLDEQALLTDVDMERIEGLHVVQVAFVEERLAQRRHPEVDERAAQVGVRRSGSSPWSARRPGVEPHTGGPTQLVVEAACLHRLTDVQEPREARADELVEDETVALVRVAAAPRRPLRTSHAKPRSRKRGVELGEVHAVAAGVGARRPRAYSTRLPGTTSATISATSRIWWLALVAPDVERLVVHDIERSLQARPGTPG